MAWHALRCKCPWDFINKNYTFVLKTVNHIRKPKSVPKYKYVLKRLPFHAAQMRSIKIFKYSSAENQYDTMSGGMPYNSQTGKPGFRLNFFPVIGKVDSRICARSKFILLWKRCQTSASPWWSGCKRYHHDETDFAELVQRRYLTGQRYISSRMRRANWGGNHIIWKRRQMANSTGKKLILCHPKNWSVIPVGKASRKICGQKVWAL